MKSSINDIKKCVKQSKDGKTVIANLGYLSLLQIAGYAFPLITMPYLARVIGVEGFGKIAFAQAIVGWFQTIADWGFTFTATRDVAQNRNNKEIVSRIFSNVFWARSLLTLLSGIFLSIAVATIPHFRDNSSVIFVTFLLIPGHIMFPDWFFQAIEKMKYTTIFNLVIKLLFTIAVFVVIREKNDYIWQPLLTTLGYVVCGTCALFLILYKWQYKLYPPRIKDILPVVKNSTDVFVNNLMPNLYNSFSVMLLGIFGGSVVNGIYEGGNKFPTIFYNLQSVLSRAFFPFLSRKLDKHSLFAKINIGSAFIGSLILIILSPNIIKIMLGSEFEGSILIMQILSISIISLAFNNTYGINFLLINHHERSLRNLTVISSLIGMIVAIPLVYYLQSIGAALVILLCRSLLGFMSYFVAKRCMNKNEHYAIIKKSN